MSIFYQGMKTSILFTTSSIKNINSHDLRIFVGLNSSVSASALASHQGVCGTSEISPEGMPNLLLFNTTDPFVYLLADESIEFHYVFINNGPDIIGPTQITIHDEKIDSGAAFNCGNSDTLLTFSISIIYSRNCTISLSDLRVPLILTRATAHAANFDSNLTTITLAIAVTATTTSSSTNMVSRASTTTSSFPSRRINIGSIPEIAVTRSKPTDSRPLESVQPLQILPITVSNTNLIVGLVFGLVILGSFVLNISYRRQKSHQYNDQQNRGRS